MNKLNPILFCILAIFLAAPVMAADHGIVGKNGETVPIFSSPMVRNLSEVRADVEFNTTGVMDLPATQGGDYEGWGTHFIGRWHNTTGEDVSVIEFGWPCGGFWVTSWYVWISDVLPGSPGTQNFHGNFLAASEDGFEYPPSIYTYVDVANEGIVVPANGTMYFGYANPGMGGQITTNGVESWSYFEGAWDADIEFNRTAVLQFKGNINSVSEVGQGLPLVAANPVANPNPFNPRTTISFDLSGASLVDLSIHDLRGQLVNTLVTENLEAGHHKYVWDGTGSDGRSLASGTYLVRLVSIDGIRQSKLILVR